MYTSLLSELTEGLDIINSVEKEFGFIKPNGTIDHFDWNKYTHVSYASEYLVDYDVPTDMLVDDDAEQFVLNVYMEKTGNIRLSVWQKGMNVQFITMTFDQLGTIRRKAQENERFDYDIYRNDGTLLKSGKSLRELRTDLQKYKLLR